MHEPLAECSVAAESRRGEVASILRETEQNRHSYSESIRAIQFNRRFLSYGAKVVLKKHLFRGVFNLLGVLIPIDQALHIPSLSVTDAPIYEQ